MTSTRAPRGIRVAERIRLVKLRRAKHRCAAFAHIMMWPARRVLAEAARKWLVRQERRELWYTRRKAELKPLLFCENGRVLTVEDALPTLDYVCRAPLNLKALGRNEPYPAEYHRISLRAVSYQRAGVPFTLTLYAAPGQERAARDYATRTLAELSAEWASLQEFVDPEFQPLMPNGLSFFTAHRMDSPSGDPLISPIPKRATLFTALLAELHDLSTRGPL